MKIDFSTTDQQMQQTELNEKFFSIADPAFIFDLLRNKIYSNPILAVCRELSCNALDAHREVGKGDVPIEITLPSYEDLYFKVKDFGPGISPSRIDDIYLKYAASTKRDSNDQIGAFGIGAKSPFSYSESFTIVTNHEGICYNYMAFIDESRMGKLILLSESETSDSNGTEIIVPVKHPGDVMSFVENVEKSTRHWSTKPKFLGPTKCQYKIVDQVIGEGDWFISSDRENYYERKVKVLVGETEYNLDSTSLKSFCDTSILSAVNADVYLRFNVGDISLAANRESVYLDPQTKRAIELKMNRIKSEYIRIVSEKISSQPTYWDACCFVSNEIGQICYDLKVLDPITWNGRKVIREFYPSENFSIFEFYQRKGYYSANPKIHRRIAHSIPPSRRNKVIIHDCGSADPTSRHMKKFFEEGENNYYVICPKNSDKEDFNISSFVQKEGLDIFDYALLSKHNRVIKTKKQSEKVKMMIYKMSNDGHFVISSLQDVTTDTKEKLFVSLRKDSFRNHKNPIDLDGKIMDIGVLTTISKSDKNVSIYGVDENIEESRVRSVLKNSIHVDDYISNWLDQVDQDFYYETIWARNQMDSSQGCRFARSYLNLKDRISSSNGALRQLLSHYETISNMVDSRKDFINMVFALGKGLCEDPEFEEYCKSKSKISDYFEKASVTYPLLEALDQYRMHNYQTHVVDYINLVDKSITS